MPMRAKTKQKKFSFKYLIILVITLALGWSLSRSMISPLNINLISTDKPGYTQSPVAPEGCYYKQVQCIQAPCDPMLVCESPVPLATPPKREICTQIAGTCTGLDGNCVNFTNGCERARLCALDQAPSGTCSIARPPSATPPIGGVITNLYATVPCGEAHYKSFVYTCLNGQKYSEETQCLNIKDALINAQNKCRTGI